MIIIKIKETDSIEIIEKKVSLAIEMYQKKKNKIYEFSYFVDESGDEPIYIWGKGI